jgi:hypothetical protein
MTESRPEWAPAGTSLDQPGSARVISKMLQMRNTNSPEPMYWRTRDEIESLFEGFAILEPGVVRLPLWRPDAEDRERAAQNPERYASYAAVGTKPPVTTG